MRIAHEIQRHVQSFRWKQGAQARGPFDERDALGEGVFDIQFDRLIGLLQTIEIEMPDAPTAGLLIHLHQGECGARHIFLADEGASEEGLAGAQIAGQRDDIPGPGDAGNAAGQRGRRRLVGQRQAPFGER